MLQTLKWATAHLSIRLGARHRGAGRADWGAGRWAQARAARRERKGAQARAGARGTMRGSQGHDMGRAGARHGAHRGARRCDTAGWFATTLPLRTPGRACARLGVLLG